MCVCVCMWWSVKIRRRKQKNFWNLGSRQGQDVDLATKNGANKLDSRKRLKLKNVIPKNKKHVAINFVFEKDERKLKWLANMK